MSNHDWPTATTTVTNIAETPNLLKCGWAGAQADMSNAG